MSKVYKPLNTGKQTTQIAQNSESYRRILYSLKLTTRLINGKFKDVQIHQFNTSSHYFDKKFGDKQIIECWELAKGEDKQILSQQELSIDKNKPRIFTAGTIIDSPEQIFQDPNLEFYLFKVAIGKSYCLKVPQQNADGKDSKIDAKSEAKKHPQVDGYESTYIDMSNQNKYQNHYIIYNQEQVLFTYKVTCKIEIEEQHQNLDNLMCSCGEQATKFCVNCDRNICSNCDTQLHSGAEHLPDNIRDIMASHNVVPLQDENIRTSFGYCTEHKTKPYEFFCTRCNQPFCTQDVIDATQSEPGKHQLIDIKQVYSDVKNNAQKIDNLLDDKKKLIIEKMNIIQDKIRTIKQEAEKVQTEITNAMQQAMTELHTEVKRKSDILKADRLELSRQHREIDFMTQFLKLQANECHPLEFLNIYYGHQLQKDLVYNQKAILNDISTTFTLHGSIHINTDSGLKQIDSNDTQLDKQNIANKGQNIIQQQMLGQRSTQMRTQLLNSREVNSMLFNQQRALVTNQSKVPTMMRSNNDAVLSNDYGASFLNDRSQIPFNDHQYEQRTKAGMDIASKIDKAFKAIEEHMNSEDKLVEESIHKSIFGIFNKNWQRFKKLDNHDNSVILKRYFNGSQILDDHVLRVLLYFNLPFEEIIRDLVQPKKIFFYDKKHNNNNQTLLQMLEQFEIVRKQNPSSGHKFQTETVKANIILMSVVNDNEMDLDEDGVNQKIIIGGYASHEWLTSELKRGDETCFLFNLTQNLRFNAKKGKGYYQVTVPDSNDSNLTVKFGQSDLVIDSDFNYVTSKISNDSSSHFAFGNELTQKSKIDSIIPGLNNFKAQKVEVWTFDINKLIK